MTSISHLSGKLRQEAQGVTLGGSFQWSELRTQLPGVMGPGDGEVSDTAGARSQRILNARPKVWTLACK